MKKLQLPSACCSSLWPLATSSLLLKPARSPTGSGQPVRRPRTSVHSSSRYQTLLSSMINLWGFILMLLYFLHQSRIVFVVFVVREQDNLVKTIKCKVRTH